MKLYENDEEVRVQLANTGLRAAPSGEWDNCAAFLGNFPSGSISVLVIGGYVRSVD